MGEGAIQGVGGAKNETPAALFMTRQGSDVYPGITRFSVHWRRREENTEESSTDKVFLRVFFHFMAPQLRNIPLIDENRRSAMPYFTGSESTYGLPHQAARATAHAFEKR
jgi:hypothetical protein